MSKRLVYLAILGLFLTSTALMAEVGKLTKIVDGDTVVFGKVKCRIINIDTPEAKPNNKAKRDAKKCKGVTVNRMVQAGKLASKHAKSILQIGKSYKYEVHGKDRYKRSLCVVKLNNRVTFNDKMVIDGYAVPYYKYIDASKQRYYRKLSKSARVANRGLYKEYKEVMMCLENR
jgi:endonuclease YncB( thermonuclease family)